jgi:hypothetical protein
LKKLLAGLPDNTGVMVYHIMPESPAVLAGLERYDVLLRADGQPVTNTEKLEEVLSRRNFGTSVRLDVIHEGQPRIVHVLVLERPASERPVAVPGGFSSGPVSVMVLSSDGRGNISSNTTVKQKLTYTDASGARHELTGDQIAEFHKRMREDEEFRKTVKDQRIEIQSESIHIGSGAAAGAAGRHHHHPDESVTGGTVSHSSHSDRSWHGGESRSVAIHRNRPKTIRPFDIPPNCGLLGAQFGKKVCSGMEPESKN